MGAEEQALAGSVQLEQAQKELFSFQQAHAALKGSNAALVNQLVAEEKCIEKLKYDHKKMNLDLNGLARHYMDALPLLPGLEKLVSRPITAPEEPKEEGDTVEPITEDMNVIHL